MNNKLKRWLSVQKAQYFWYTLILSTMVLIPAAALVTSNNWLSISLNMTSIVILVAGATITGRKYLRFDLVEDVIGQHLWKKETYLVVNPKQVKVVLVEENLNQVSHIEYGGEVYSSDLTVHVGYKFSFEFYQPGIFLCEVSFTNSLRHNLIFVVERLDAVEYLTTVYGYAHK